MQDELSQLLSDQDWATACQEAGGDLPDHPDFSKGYAAGAERGEFLALREKKLEARFFQSLPKVSHWQRGYAEGLEDVYLETARDLGWPIDLT